MDDKNKEKIENSNEIEKSLDDVKIFSTRDLYLAATLVTNKFFMIGIDYQIEGEKNLPVGYFKFENSDELQQVRQRYTQGILLVEPKSFITNLRSLKAEVMNEYKNPYNG